MAFMIDWYGPPRPTFSDIWEKEGRWILGPNILADIVRHVEGKGLVAGYDLADPNTLGLSVPLPSAASFVPEKLLPIFWEAVASAMRTWLLNVPLDQWLGERMTAFTVAGVNAQLHSVENTRRAHNDHEQLYRLLADNFGLVWWALPKTAFAGPPIVFGEATAPPSPPS